jgi:hypothetical protein
MDKDDTTNMLINPYSAINIEPDLATEHSPIVPESKWVQTNLHLIDELGPKEWLERLLAVLQGDYPRSPGELTSPHDEPADV